MCKSDNGRLWGKSLCGPMIISDAATKTSATNQPAPDAPKPPALGFANAAMNWGGVRWTTLVWQIVPADEHLRARLMLHELFHRIQPELGLLGEDGHNEHLDTLEGRYLVRLEWRALAKALEASGPERLAALADAFAFRRARQQQFPGAAENERRLEINEGLAQYTGTVLTSSSPVDAENDAAYQLVNASENSTFVRTFPYASGAAYGLLLDRYSEGWRQRIKAGDDLSSLVATAAKVVAAADVNGAAARYGGPDLRISEQRRDAERQARLAELRGKFVDGAVVVLPAAKSSSFTTNGMSPIPGVGTMYPNFRGNGDWGSVEAAAIVVSEDRQTLILNGPATISGSGAAGEGWKVSLSPGWKLVAGSRAGDYKVEAGK